MNDLDQRGSRQPAQDVPVGDCRSVRTDPGNILQISVSVVKIQANGGHAHHAAAAFTVVDGLFNATAFF